jgi:catechol 2,3-dioxygenase-like lactoylglutathione lyase family enzyme
MFLPKSHIHLDADDLTRSAAFYEALLGSPPSRRSESVAIFEFDSPPLVLTLEQRPPENRPKLPPAGNVRSLRRREDARDYGALRVRSPPRFALVVNEPQQVGHAAIALRRAGVQLRLEDEGIEADDPDGNGWRVRCVPSARGRAVVAPAPEDGGRR